MRNVCVACTVAAVFTGALIAQAQSDPHAMKQIAKVDPRFQSYNVEMVEVIGGRFWKPYPNKPLKDLPSQTTIGVVGVDPNLFEQRTPVDLSNPRLRKLAFALGPAYMRVSGSWANTMYFQDTDAPAPAKPPAGFGGVLTRAQWKGVANFANAVDAKIVTSFSVIDGTRDAQGVWMPAQAEAFLKYSRSIGAPIAAAEFFNEPTIPSVAGVPKGYDAAAYGRDFKTFVPVFRKYATGALLLGPSGTAEGADQPPMLKLVPSSELLQQTGSKDLDAFSYHVYPTISERCAARAPANLKLGVTPDEAMSDEFLTRTDTVEQFYAKLRDQYAPGKPIWLTETGEAACGGDRWAATYLDTFRYLYQLGTLARRDVQVVMHNTLAASDYGLIDERTLVPRPNYWAALLWHNLMGTTVLDAGASPSTRVKLFAQCTKSQPGSVTLLAINLDQSQPQTLTLAERGERYTLTATTPQAKTVELNGQELTLSSTGDLPKLHGQAVKAGSLTLPPASSSFVVVQAKNPACESPQPR